MEYGNTPRALYRVAVIGMSLGFLTAMAGIVMGLIEGTLVWNRLLHALLFLLLGPFVLVLAVAPTVLFRIRIADGRVQHIFLGGYVLSDYPLQDLRWMRRFEGGCAAVLHFAMEAASIFSARTGERLRDSHAT
jgi:hypothetical protein